MSEQHLEDALDTLLGFEEDLPQDEFVLNVMHGVARQRRIRRLVLATFGLIGAVFGLVGATLLSAPIAQLFASLPATGTMQAVLVVCAAAAFYTWFMNDDLSLPS